jgi:glyoxylase-like metal-dependent hydrolase (beta-lactamase superfamily II)/rhodanese-related sulfurtransferase
MGNLVFRQLNPHACRSYLIGTAGAPDVVLVDPVLEHVDDYLRLLEKEGLRLSHAIDTHTHADHISGAPSLRDRTDCEYVAHQAAPAGCVTVRVADGFKCHIADIPVEVLHTPGHTKDSMSLVLSDRILTGDVLFLDDGGAGRDDLPGGDPAEHWESLQRISRLPEHLLVCPAHDYHDRQPSSLAQQKKTNPHLRSRTKEEFIKYLDDLKLGPAEWMKDVLKANYACARDPKAAWIPVDVPACEVKGTLGPGVNAIQVPSMPAEELKRRLDQLDAPILLDVREPAELSGALAKLPGVLNIPVAGLSGSLPQLEAYRDREVVTVCRSGGRALTAAQILLQDGFKHVYVLSGGMAEWNQKGYPTEAKGDAV